VKFLNVKKLCEKWPILAVLGEIRPFFVRSDINFVIFKNDTFCPKLKKLSRQDCSALLRLYRATFIALFESAIKTESANKICNKNKFSLLIRDFLLKIHIS
jgi:hypothetical protein